MRSAPLPYLKWFKPFCSLSNHHKNTYFSSLSKKSQPRKQDWPLLFRQLQNTKFQKCLQSFYLLNILYIVNVFDLTEGISRPLTETVISGHISALSETVTSECFAAQSANLTMGRIFCPCFYNRRVLLWH